jgi:hypothetical protein
MNSSMNKKFIQRTLICFAVLYGFLVVTGSELLPPAYTATAEATIAATPTKTWRVLIEFMQCKNWNPYLIAGARGMGISIALPDGRSHNFTGNNFPVLAGKNPEIFFGFLSTLSPDENSQCNPAETAAYISEHPSVDANAAWT